MFHSLHTVHEGIGYQIFYLRRFLQKKAKMKDYSTNIHLSRVESEAIRVSPKYGCM